MLSKNLNRPVFFSATSIILALLIFSGLMPQTANSLFTTLQNSLTINLGWFYALTVAIILIFVIYLACSTFGSIRLGPEHSQPEYCFSAWLSMLFAAGMGIGLMFFGVSEPVMHFLSPATSEPQTIMAVKEAMKTTFFHWGIHAWAIYAVVALILAYFGFRKGLPLTLRSALFPLIGRKIYGWQGNLVDVFAVVCTVFGIATSLGLGASQVNAGLSYLFGLNSDISNQIWIMMFITLLSATSVALGLDKGIKFLSEINMILAIFLLILIFFLGSTLFLLQAYVQNIGSYLADIVRLTFNLFAYQKDNSLSNLTTFYWGWWLAWAPFVGLFIARISKGRTIREFVMGVMAVPTAFTLLWMTIFGNSAILLIFDAGVTELATMVNKNSAVALFVFLEQLPFSNLLSFLSLLMIVIFFVSSCDSGALVLDMLCSNGSTNTPTFQRLFWAINVGLVATILTLIGGLNALQTMTIATALPFSIILLLAMFGFIKALIVDETKKASLKISTMQIWAQSENRKWQAHLDNIIETVDENSINHFLDKTALPAIDSIREYFTKKNIQAEVRSTTKEICLNINQGGKSEFIYAIICTESPLITGHQDYDTNNFNLDYRAEVHLAEGGQGYDIMGWSQQDVINDIIEQYHKHQHFLHLLNKNT